MAVVLTLVSLAAAVVTTEVAAHDVLLRDLLRPLGQKSEQHNLKETILVHHQVDRPTIRFLVV